MIDGPHVQRRHGPKVHRKGAKTRRGTRERASRGFCAFAVSSSPEIPMPRGTSVPAGPYLGGQARVSYPRCQNIESAGGASTIWNNTRTIAPCQGRSEPASVQIFI